MITVYSNLDFGSHYLPLPPIQNNHLVNKLYVDNKSSNTISNLNHIQPSSGAARGPLGNLSNPITFTV